MAARDLALADPLAEAASADNLTDFFQHSRQGVYRHAVFTIKAARQHQWRRRRNKMKKGIRMFATTICLTLAFSLGAVAQTQSTTANGGTVTTSARGGKVYQSPDGGVVAKGSRGRVVTKDRNGAVTAKGPNGGAAVNPNGNAAAYGPNRTAVRKNGTTTVRQR
jgi:hypothetical protein